MLQEFVEHFTYAGLFLALLAGGLGLPIPEEAVIVAGGALAHQEVVRWWFALPACLLGVLLGDVGLYWAGHHWGERILAWPLVRRALSPERARTISAGYRRYGVKILFATRHMMGLRASSFLMAGAVHIPFWKFVVVDASQALITVPFTFGIAYTFTDHVMEIVADAHRVERWIGLVALVAGVAALVIVVHRRSRIVIGAIEE